MTCCCLSLAFISCKKKEQPKPTMDLTIEVTDVTAINARLAIDGTGDTPSLVRYMAPGLAEDMYAAIDTADVEAVKGYISQNGVAIDLPYTEVLTELTPEATYVVGVIAFDEQMNAFGYDVETFTMKDLASMFEETLGDPSNAGNLTENILK